MLLQRRDLPAYRCQRTRQRPRRRRQAAGVDSPDKGRHGDIRSIDPSAFRKGACKSDRFSRISEAVKCSSSRPCRRVAAGSCPNVGCSTTSTAGARRQGSHRTALLLVAVGALSGFLAGVFGIGGGAVLVPVFYECFRLAGVPLEVRIHSASAPRLRSSFPDLALLVSRPLRPRRGRHGHPQALVLPIVIGVVAGASRAPAVRRSGCSRSCSWWWRGRRRRGCCWHATTSEARRRRAEGLSDARLRLLRRAVVDLDGRRRRLVANLLMTFYGRPIHRRSRPRRRLRY